MDVHLKDLFTRFQEQFSTGPGLGPSSGTCLLKVDGIAPSFIKSLFHASAGLYRTNPWKHLRPGHLFGVRVGRDTDWSNKKQPFPCGQFIGGDGGDLGLNLFKSEQDALKMTGEMGTNRVPNIELLRVAFELESVLLPSNRRMVRSLALEVSGEERFPVIDIARCTSNGGVRFRNPTLEELRYVYAVMKAMVLVHPLLQISNVGVPRRGRLMQFEPFIETVDVQWPPEVGRSWDLVAVTISHPPSQTYVEIRPATSPTRYLEPPKEELPLVEVKAQRDVLRQCAMCSKEVQGEQSLCCGRCRAVVYCGPVCQKQHWKDAHKSLCGLYKAMMEREEELIMSIFSFPCFINHPCKWLEEVGLHQKGMWRRKCSCYSHCPFGLLPNQSSFVSESWGDLSNVEYPHNVAFTNYQDGNSTPILLSGWSEYYNLCSLPMSSPVAAILSHPLTVYHILTALCINSKNHLIKDREVIVHYLGPEGELDWMPAFAELGHLLNGSGHLQIIMVGPGVPSNLSGTSSAISKRVKVDLVRGLYQDEAAHLPSPHVILALNCGFENYGTWGTALELIKSINIPAFFTEKSEVACFGAKQVLRGAGLHVMHPVTPNPFRSPVCDEMPWNNLPSFSNCFVFGVNT